MKMKWRLYNVVTGETLSRHETASQAWQAWEENGNLFCHNVTEEVAKEENMGLFETLAMALGSLFVR